MAKVERYSIFMSDKIKFLSSQDANAKYCLKKIHFPTAIRH